MRTAEAEPTATVSKPSVFLNDASRIATSIPTMPEATWDVENIISGTVITASTEYGI